MSNIRHEPIAPTGHAVRRRGHVLDRHRHDDHQLIYVSTGVLSIGTAQGTWIASPDRAVWIPAGVWHEHRAYGHSAVHTVGFPQGCVLLPLDTPTVVAASGLVRELLVACTDPQLSTVEFQRIRAVLRDRLRRARTQPLTLPSASDTRLADACRLVAEDLAQPQPLARIAARVNVSERTLSRLFRAEFGTTYPQWRNKVRVFHAMIRLAEGASVTDAGRQCGWATTSAFIDTFTRTMGQTPGTYRTLVSTTEGHATRAVEDADNGQTGSGTY